jgi:hypothetical protein
MLISIFMVYKHSENLTRFDFSQNQYNFQSMRSPMLKSSTVDLLSRLDTASASIYMQHFAGIVTRFMYASK